MANINTSGAQGGRDFTYGASPMQEQRFMDLYDEIMHSLNKLYQIEDKTTFNIELNKIRKKMTKLITKYFEGSLSELSSMELYKNSAASSLTQLKKIRTALDI